MPRPLSSPTIRLYPQCGFSWPSRRISVRSDDSSGGRPGARCVDVQRRATSRRCQRNSVSGLTGKPAQATRGSERLSAASNARSARVSFGCRPCRRSVASSVAQHQDLELLRATRPRQQPHGREQVPHGEIRERSEQAALPQARQQEREPSQMAAGGEPGRVCEPYLCHERGEEVDVVGETL
jgi:hypothetical protein